MRSRSTTLPGIPLGHHRRTRSTPRRRVRLLAGQRAGLSDAGLTRPVNQDAFLATARLLATADGVGGGPSGEVAARLAVDALAAGASTARTLQDLVALAADASAAVHDAGAADPRSRAWRPR